MQHNSPDSDHAAEQREADERASFVRDCAQDGVARMHRAQGGEWIIAVGTGRTGMYLALAAAQFATARNRAFEMLFHDVGPPEP